MRSARSIAASKSSLGRTMALAGLVYCILIVIFSGCKVTENNYKTLSFFFDGVPDPNAPPTTGPSENGSILGTGGGGKVVAFVHKPYAENKCDACHGSTAKQYEDFQKPSPTICVTCHQKELNKFPIMHGPVAVGECLLCHAPHESSIPGMLNKPSPQVCVQCHIPELLPRNPPEHLSDQSCLDCHYAHGGDKHGFLRKTVATTQPTARPTTEAIE